ncbi:GNAT family N-acetyltransferase [Pseudobutyrivibrio sp. MD2005]|uniref:GNAT family N-acetyltransferase n=1 Tax=Pseudobutyrivibrio sp. MD2005 TaxID=1410616 RepID=UPI000486D120|nr:GNAT family N-acetyltransferase [Pseudobutyrivibrio sp. MD2005]
MIVCRVEKEETELLHGLAPEEELNAFYRDENISALALIDGDEIVGCLIGEIIGGVYRVYWLYVEPASRRKGGAKKLIRTLKEILDTMAISIHVAWEGEPDVNEELCGFLNAQGFLREKNQEIKSYSVKISSIAPAEKTNKKSDKVVSFEELGKDFLESMQNDEAANEERMMPEGGFLNPAIRKDLSFVVVKKDKPIAYIVFMENGDVLELSTLYSTGASNTIISYLLYEASYVLKEKCDENQILHINAVSEGVEALVKYFIPDAIEVSNSYYG